MVESKSGWGKNHDISVPKHLSWWWLADVARCYWPQNIMDRFEMIWSHEKSGIVDFPYSKPYTKTET